MTEEEILNRMTKMADALGFTLNNNAIKIAKIKSRMDNWRRCPCDRDNPDRYCGSILCEEDTLRDSKCHCCCFCRIKND